MLICFIIEIYSIILIYLYIFMVHRGYKIIHTNPYYTFMKPCAFIHQKKGTKPYKKVYTVL